MRTTIELSEDVYRALKVRSALTGTTMRELVQRLVEQGLRQPVELESPRSGHREPPPVIVAPRGTPIAAMSTRDLRRLDEEDDERHAGPA